MATYGLRVWNPDTTLRLEVSSRLLRYQGTTTVTVPKESTSFVTVTGMSRDGSWGVFPSSVNRVNVSIDSGGISVQNCRDSTSAVVTLVIFRC